MGTNVNAPRCPVDHRTLRNSVHKKIDFEEIFSLKLNGNSLPIRWRPYANAWETFKSWVLTFLSKPHPDLGRKGAVCPFTHKSYLLDYFLTNIQETAMPSFE